MYKRFKRKFWGYDPSYVEEEINTIELNHDKKMKEREASLKRLNEEAHVLKDEMEKIREEVSHYRQFEESISKTLLAAYMKANEEVFNASERAENYEEDLHEEMNTQIDTREKLKKTLKAMVGDLHFKLDEYKQKMEMPGKV